MSFKKLFSLLMFMSVTSSGFAQIKLGVTAGLNYSNVTAKDRDGNTQATSSIPGFHLGLAVAYHLSEEFSVNPSLIYAKRGFKANGATGIGLGSDFEAKLSYVELPVDLMYSPKVGPGNLLIAAGPYIGYGRGGKWKTRKNVLIGDINIGDKGEVAFQADAVYADYGTYVYGRPWDYGAHFKIGYAFPQKYTVSFEMQQGIANLESRWGDYQPTSSLRNRSVGVSLGYQF